MTPSALTDLIKSNTPYRLLALRTDHPHTYVDLGRTLPDGHVARYTFALSDILLQDAIDPASIVLAHLEIANADLATAETALMPMWG